MDVEHISIRLDEQPTKHFVDYLNEHCRNWIYIKKYLQSIISCFCVYYCCMSACIDVEVSI